MPQVNEFSWTFSIFTISSFLMILLLNLIFTSTIGVNSFNKMMKFYFNFNI